MVKRLFLLFIILLASGSIVLAQRADKIVMSINGNPIYASDFEESFRKGQSVADKHSMQYIEKFLQLYIDFKLNAIEGRMERLDTTPSFKRDYISYRIQASQLFKKAKDSISVPGNPFLSEIYKRMLEDVEINHVLIPFGKKEVFPSDTLFTYNKAMDLRKGLISNGFKRDDFSDHTKVTGIISDIEYLNGYLGWIIPFMLSYPVETAVYNTPVGSVSMPVRSNKGYHLVQVLNKRPALGTYNVDRVLIGYPDRKPTEQEKDSVKALALEIQKHLHTEEDFVNLCQANSAYLNISEGNCAFGSFRQNAKIPKVLLSEIFKLKNIGDVSGAIETADGYSFVRLTGKGVVPELDKMKDWLRETIYKSDRADVYSMASIKRYTEKYGLDINKKAYERLNETANSFFPLDTLFVQKVTNPNDILFTIGGSRKYNVRNFTSHLSFSARKALYEKEMPGVVMEKGMVEYTLSNEKLQELFTDFYLDAISEYADSTLETRIPEFGKLKNNYVDDALAYAVLDKHVWQKARVDDKGLSEFFEKNKERYEWRQPRYKGVILHCKTAAIAEELEIALGGTSDVRAVSEIIAKNGLNNDSVNLRIESGVWTEDENKYVESKVSGRVLVPVDTLFSYPLVLIRMISSPEDYTDVRGLVENDYQQLLLKQWNAYLRSKYDVKVNNSVLKSIK